MGLSPPVHRRDVLLQHGSNAGLLLTGKLQALIEPLDVALDTPIPVCRASLRALPYLGHGIADSQGQRCHGCGQDRMCETFHGATPIMSSILGVLKQAPGRPGLSGT